MKKIKYKNSLKNKKRVKVVNRGKIAEGKEILKVIITQKISFKG